MKHRVTYTWTAQPTLDGWQPPAIVVVADIVHWQAHAFQLIAQRHPTACGILILEDHRR